MIYKVNITLLKVAAELWNLQISLVKDEQKMQR